MKLVQKSLISAAVSAAIMAPIAAQAEVTVYGRINQAIDLSDRDDSSDSTTDISNVASRIGVKASSNLGNGLTAAAQYEFSTTPDRETDNINDLRVGTVSLSGAFGSVTVGNQWSAFYNNVGTHIDPTYSLGYYLYSSAVGAPYRASNTIKYSNSFGAVNLQLDVRVNDGDTAANAEKIHGEGFGIGINFQPIDNLTVALAYDTEDSDVPEGGPISLLTVATAATDGVMPADVPALTAAAATAQTMATNAPDNAALQTANVEAQAALAAGILDSDRRAAVVALNAPDFDEKVNRTGVAAKYDFGSYYGILAWHQRSQGDDEVSQVQAYGGTNLTDSTSVLLGYGVTESDATDAEPSQITIGVYHNVGGGLRLYFESAMIDYDDAAADLDRHLVGMRYDF